MSRLRLLPRRAVAPLFVAVLAATSLVPAPPAGATAITTVTAAPDAESNATSASTVPHAPASSGMQLSRLIGWTLVLIGGGMVLMSDMRRRRARQMRRLNGHVR